MSVEIECQVNGEAPLVALSALRGHDCSLLPAYEILGEEHQICRPFRQSAHQVVVPVGPKRSRHQHSIAALYEIKLELRTNAVQHLKLETIVGDAFFLGHLDDMIDDPLIVRGDRGKTAIVQHPRCEF